MSNIYVKTIPFSNRYYFYRYDNIGTVQQIGRYTPDSVFCERKRGRRFLATRIANGTLEIHGSSGNTRLIHSLSYHIDRLKFFCDNGSTDPQDEEMLKAFRQVATEWS
jgi:hypothetical protein